MYIRGQDSFICLLVCPDDIYVKYEDYNMVNFCEP